eukprot:1893674-Pleurochrysis_carterae.AAC.1
MCEVQRGRSGQSEQAKCVSATLHCASLRVSVTREGGSEQRDKRARAMKKTRTHQKQLSQGRGVSTRLIKGERVRTRASAHAKWPREENRGRKR